MLSREISRGTPKPNPYTHEYQMKKKNFLIIKNIYLYIQFCVLTFYSL